MKRSVAVVLILVFVLMMAGCSQDKANDVNATNKDEVGNILAVVDGEEITLEAFEKTYAIVKRNYIEIYGEDALSQEYNGKALGELIKVEIMNNMILDVLKYEYVKSLDQAIEVAEIEDAYQKYYDAEMKDNVEQAAFYKENGIDEAFIKSQIESSLYASRFVEILEASVNETDSIDDETFEAMVARVSARHILVATLEEADAVIARIKSGEAFEVIAAEVSTDTGSGALGGDLGFFMRGEMVPAFEDAAFELEVGVVSEPVESQFGFHIIKVDNRQTIADMRANEVSEEEINAIRQNLMEAKIEAAYHEKVAELMEAATIERHDELIGQ
ncbi:MULTISPECIES: peptidylprolyl isomerase [unclassified Fusibacter]|uniref:peptidylprolyl isomerase n=1 Tax=unclassified Fusibacter TaxID=2624464 RepID=UPI00101297EB|nr:MULTISPECIES: peptidylprolyl isomerase [unclassified Fusibacter]MCK8059522.1 peptidylprolyl isomerase [Fusibacter sp. A2]NPE21014.1 hypothetical protein [Fusibacter sp. A1]RXV62288.1 hypothetical protein DWB64_04205 [Fusibacter sp. A1]